MILTARLLLRPARASDLAAMHAIMADPRVMAFWSTDPHTDPAQTVAFLDAMIAEGPDSDDLIAELRSAPGVAIGKIGFWRAEEAGLLLSPTVWRQGLAYEAYQTLIPRQFAKHPALDSLLADIDPRNLPSVALFQKLGFVQTGFAKNTFCLGGVWTDSVYLSLPRPKTDAKSHGAGTIR
ncbi:N-acetyltransferase [Pseudorhodobacter sp. E13]|uniref:GNAT family N-acetyltransferase n=1 Tax=Pseudorhodobacter sp. E13 TaxID=2487931 RepID=UPI000F8DDAF6|nr:GNAT family N-acetyltransferase [Pseudorhodobacter sp. E13]RUS59133.1 N-acetyltransferase [Pseudorhodobacter sp. E13]